MARRRRTRGGGVYQRWRARISPQRSRSHSAARAAPPTADGTSLSSSTYSVETWHDPDLGRPIAAPLERCAELGVDLASIREATANVEPYFAPTAPGSGA
jgi:hypothetical protein